MRQPAPRRLADLEHLAAQHLIRYPQETNMPDDSPFINEQAKRRAAADAASDSHLATHRAVSSGTLSSHEAAARTAASGTNTNVGNTK
jgi:hypothetical protein